VRNRVRGTYGLAKQGAGPGNAGAQKTKTDGSSGTNKHGNRQTQRNERKEKEEKPLPNEA